MSLNSIKSLTLAMALISVVACGKNNNNLNVDGYYQEQSDEATKALVLMNIKDNISTTYRVSADGKSVEVSKEELIIKGDKLVGSESLENLCEKNEALVDDSTQILKKVQGNLIVLNSDRQIITKLISISKDEFNSLSKNLIIDGKLQTACLNAEGKAVKKVDGTKVIDIIEKVEATEVDAKVEDVKIEDLKLDAATASELETIGEDKI